MNLKELRTVLSSLGEYPTEKMLDQMMTEFDEDGNEVIGKFRPLNYPLNKVRGFPGYQRFWEPGSKNKERGFEIGNLGAVRPLNYSAVDSR